jgi:hypothetical protein
MSGPRKRKSSRQSIRREMEIDPLRDDKKLKIESHMHEDGIQTQHSSSLSDVKTGTILNKEPSGTVLEKIAER